MEKTKNKKWYHYLIIYILGFIIYTSMVLTITYCNNNKKAKAYTNDVVLYADEQITDLSGTSWELNDYIALWTESTTYNINFTSNNENFNTLLFYYDLTFGPDDDVPLFYTELFYDDLKIYQQGYLINLNYKTINITGGIDATNTNLISYLQSNATQLITEEFYNINYNLQNVLIIGEKPTQISNLEEINIEFQNFNNYELPQNIMVDGASYNWNNETGILTIYNATGNVTITVRAEYISGNYSFIELIDSVVLIPLNAFFNLFNFEIFGVNIYALLTATLTLFVIIKILLKVFK